MVRLNHHYQKLAPSQLKEALLLENTPDVPWIDLASTDPIEPVFPSVSAAMQAAVEEMATSCSELKNLPLCQTIASFEYQNLPITAEDIFLSNGARSDLADLQELFDMQNTVAVVDPSYPLYLETNVIAGRTKPLRKAGGYGGVVYLKGGEEVHFQPQVPRERADLVYLCSPNNPTGVALTKETLTEWVSFAKKKRALLLFDGTYSPFIQSPEIPRSIYEIEGANEVAIEVRSFSKQGRFSRLRCSYTVIPRALHVEDAGRIQSLHSLWTQRRTIKFRALPYPIQKGALALYTPEGQKEMKAHIKAVQMRSELLLQGLLKKGHTVYGGIDAPLLWWKVSPNHFTYLLREKQLITLPGTRFSLSGNAFVRLSGFSSQEAIEQALERIDPL